jgi:hypothetical protein
MREARNEIRWTCMAGGCLLVKSLVGRREEEEKMERMVYKEIWQVMIMETRRIGQEQKWRARKDLPLLTLQSSGMDRRHVITREHIEE